MPWRRDPLVIITVIIITLSLARALLASRNGITDCTLLPPPDMVPDVSMSWPWRVTTRCFATPPWYAMRVAASRSLATRVSCSAW